MNRYLAAQVPTSIRQARAMLDALGAALLGQVLRHLPPADLRSARQAARIFDQASRQHLESFETLKLYPSNAAGARGGPDWARFPRLRRLKLSCWMQQHGEALRTLFARGGAGLSSLRGVESFCAHVDATSWAAILCHAPAVTSVTISASWAMSPPLLAWPCLPLSRQWRVSFINAILR